MSVDYHELASFISGRLPGKGVWLQSSPTEQEYRISGELEDADQTLAEGLAIRREDSWWLVIYFSITAGESLRHNPHGDHEQAIGAEDLELHTGFTADYDTLQEAKREARQLVEYLPKPSGPEPSGRRLDQDLIFEAIDDLEEEPGE